MIAHFPDPYEGELLYSVLARFAERMGYPALYTSLLELFGVRHGIPAIELPNKLDRLVSALPPGAIYTSDSIIERNTLLPFYSPFLPEQNYNLIVANMKGEGVRTTQLRAGIIAGRVSSPEYFRCCPICDQKNVDQYGETYWNRLHQIRGVEVCPIHSVFLEKTDVRFRGSTRKDALISAQSARRVTIARPVDLERADNLMRFQIAESAAWLLDKNTSRPGLLAINSGHRRVLDNSGFISPKGWIRQKPLQEKIAGHCTADLLEKFGCELRDASDGGWLGRLLRETEQGIAPLRHLLLMAVFNTSAEEFFARVMPEPIVRQSQDLFPCFNRTCPQFRAPVISRFEIKRAKHGFARIFECQHCGHRSSRAADGQSVIRVVSFGPLWAQKLRVLWPNTSLSLRNISTELDADARSVLQYAMNLRLEFPRRGPSRLTTRPGYLRVVKRVPLVMVNKEKRRAWLQLRHKYPHAGISELHRLASALYTWLYRHERQWLNENSPAHRPFVPKNDRVDWTVRDGELVDRVVSAAVCIKNEPGRPRRVTVRSIGLKLGIHTLLQMHKHRLPRTQSALKVHVESTEQFALRRILWVVNTLQIQRIRATRSDVMRIAGIGSRVLRMPSVQHAIICANEDLESFLDKTPPGIPNVA